MKNPYTFSRIFCAFVILSSITSLASASSTATHERYLYPGLDSTSLDIEGWLVPWGTEYEITITTPPSFGTLEGEEFRPSEEFWQVAADRLTIQVLSSDPPTATKHTFLFLPLTPTITTTSTLIDFETGWPHGWFEENPAGVLEISSDQPITGSFSARATVSGSATGSIHMDSNTGGGATGYGATGGTQIGPPDAPFMQTGTVVIAALGELSIEASLYEDPSSGERYYRMRGAAASNTACQPCNTPWTRVPSETLIRIGMWAGQSTHGENTNPYERPWGARFMIEPLGKAPAISWLEGNFIDRRIRLGILDPAPHGMEGLEIKYDDFYTWIEDSEFSDNGHFAEDFEAQNLSAWQTQGDIDILRETAIGGEWGAAIDLDALFGSGGELDDAILIDVRPDQETAVTALLRFDLKATHLRDGEWLRLVRGSSVDALNGGLHISLMLRRLGSQHFLQARARDDQGEIRKTPWVELVGLLHDIALQWRASSAPDADDGQIRLWVSGELAGEKLGLDNDTFVVESLAFGVHRSSLNGYGPHGTLSFDDVAVFLGH